jgi:hypothetical protein
MARAATGMFLGGFGVAFYTLGIIAAADVLVSYIPIRGERRSLSGWVQGVVN